MTCLHGTHMVSGSLLVAQALRQFQFRVGRENILFFHVSLVPVLGAVGEEKTKPTQHTVQALRAAGLSPDFLVCRSTQPLAASTKNKLALFCHVPSEHCLGAPAAAAAAAVPPLAAPSAALSPPVRRTRKTSEEPPRPMMPSCW